ncbi:acyl-CoA reductase-like NAD-dependent aldehyde dehydrogenase [Aliiruegeria haliotis]|uniref:Acyl-CoA reductase-like NAD-dependent aldehyde dehydrogenase n=1 Tax=Aliiruegeria haliotis TaxID=1280846 RepID=A0A2T0RM86_9RHOB|nr:aldehyde dehydrogenase family protein [Aliiruegeria haliotis]PRY22240.1 acyl-CoA reductase-like NAD-dependent aldehyde dehydrogenase [Aliiruegeria haliotis]
MKATEAIDHLDPQKWADTPPAERLRLLEEVRENMKRFGDELATADSRMKNDILGTPLYSDPVSKVGTVVPMANTVTAAVDLYEAIIEGRMLQPVKVEKVGNDLYDIYVFPQARKDKLIYADRKDRIRVKGEPRQVNPMDKPAGIIAVLGAGNYSSSLEMMKAIFFENCTVVHKPHHLNEKTDAVWAKIMQPLIDHGALSFCASDQGRDLTVDPRLTTIYFTGGTGTAQAIMSATDTPLISECGGNNPCIVVPGDRPWTKKEIEHQAVQIATMSKLNGGAVCGRIQTLVTSKHWPQRQEFLDALAVALEETTPATGIYYPGSDKVIEGFKAAYPDAKVLRPEGGRHPHSEVLLITGAEPGSYACTHEAFTLVIDEVPLDVPAKAAEFLPKAVDFCNTQLLGTLGSAILIDEDTKQAHQDVLAQAVTDIEYGGIAINTMPPFIFLSPYLTWGGNEEGKAFVSGHGNFGNLLNYENVEKSIIEANFMSAGHMMNTNKTAFDNMAENMSRFAVEPTWGNLTCLMGEAIRDSFRKKDF